jgi:hypothetical protein
MSRALPPDTSPYCAFAAHDLITPPPPLRVLPPIATALTSFVWGSWAPRTPPPPSPPHPSPPDLATPHRGPSLQVPDLTPQNPPSWAPPPPLKVALPLPPSVALYDARLSDVLLRFVSPASLPSTLLLTLGGDEGRGCLAWRTRFGRRLVAASRGGLILRLSSVAFVGPLVAAWVPGRAALGLRVRGDLWEGALLAARVALATEAAADDVSEAVAEGRVTFGSLCVEIE